MEGTQTNFSTTNSQMSQIETWKQNSQRLQLEGFKIEQIIAQFNNCADRCKLQYKESGLKV